MPLEQHRAQVKNLFFISPVYFQNCFFGTKRILLYSDLKQILSLNVNQSNYTLLLLFSDDFCLIEF